MGAALDALCGVLVGADGGSAGRRGPQVAPASQGIDRAPLEALEGQVVCRESG